ncbi:MAG: L-serine ammonia-lyase [Acidobacteriota bacterium]|nr:L-serine ammonia-lyase [Acidobacteriota bacterium]
MTSLFDLFKIGIGPSSSHTVGPMRAARDFAGRLQASALLERTSQVTVELYGSLALTGKGHGTDRAILLGLEGETPEGVDSNAIDARLAAIRESKRITLLGIREISLDETNNLLFHRTGLLPGHSNGMRYTAYDCTGQKLASEIYYSIGGGFIIREGENRSVASGGKPIPYPFSSADELLRLCRERGMPIHALVLENEKTWRTELEIRAGILRIWDAMQTCLRRGLAMDGVLPGGLNVPRRAPALHRLLSSHPSRDPLDVMDWINLFAMAVNEENAAGGRVVTAPTNGAAGIIPAVAQYYQQFCEGASEDGMVRYFLTATAIGSLYKRNASISGAEVGCQGEVGVACSMAAGGLVSALNGTNEQAENAAEIGMEHNLGMTCDPVGGLVQIPCIERNALGAVKAINAARMAMRGDGTHKVSLDQVIKTMYQTGLDMQSRYKETSQGGLALNVIEC